MNFWLGIFVDRPFAPLAELDRAVEIDPRYEPAKFNRVAVARMEEGRPMDIAEFKTINFNRERHLRVQGR